MSESKGPQHEDEEKDTSVVVIGKPPGAKYNHAFKHIVAMKEDEKVKALSWLECCEPMFKSLKNGIEWWVWKQTWWRSNIRSYNKSEVAVATGRYMKDSDALSREIEDDGSHVSADLRTIISRPP